MEFTTTLQLDGQTATGIRVPDEVVAALGGGKRIPVSVTINGTRYASTIATMRGEPKIPVSAGIRAAAGIAAGDTITVELERDDAPRTADVPAELADALSADPAASVRFAALSYSNQRRHILSITGARTALLNEEYHHRYRHLLDPFVALGAAAAVTTRIRLGTGICVALLYDPIILAMQVSTLDQLSSGRFVFGIGAGHEDTVQNHGVSPELRHRILREKVLAMKAIWAGGNAEFHGEFVDFAPILTGLRPRQEPHPPILIGSPGSRGIARTVEYADGWMPIVYEELDFGAQMQELELLCQAAGRPTAPVTAGLWKIDEPLMERCAELGVDRCLVVFHAEDKDSFPAFLERYSRLVDRFGD